MTSACPSPFELTRDLSTGANENIRAHLGQCDHCAAEWASIERVTALARELPEPELSVQRPDSVRNALLSAAASSGTPRRVFATPPLLFATAAAAAVALAIGGYLLFRTPTEGPDSSASVAAAEIYRATIHAQPGAEHAVVGAQPDEIVRLTEGTITFEVAPLLAGERFRVVTGDAEVEVRGTVFDVTVAADSLVAVQVISGEVVVRPADGPDDVLAAGERWPRPERGRPSAGTIAGQSQIAAPATPSTTVGASVAPRPRPVGSQPRTPSRAEERPEDSGANTGTPAVSPPAPQAAAIVEEPAPVATVNNAQIAFQRGWCALRAGDTTSAASAFGIAAKSADPIAEDASFWNAVAHARAGRNAQAAASLHRFLNRYPGSPRAGEASVMLGWKLLAAGQPAQAEPRFRAAVNDPVARVRASAVRGLQAIADRANEAPAGVR